jgi:adenylate cyclase
VDTSAFVEAGLYDPDGSDAAARLDVLEYLQQRGATIAQMRRAEAEGRLPSLAGDLVLFPDRTLSVTEVAARLGWSVEKLARVHLAMGLPFDEGQGIAEDLVHGLEIFDQGAALFGEEALLQFARVLGASAARVAESALSLFLSEIERPFVEATNADCLRLARANGEAADALLLVPDVIAALLPEHLERAIRRQRADTGPPAGERDRRNLTVGFVDLVDFTARSSRLDPNELAAVLGRFESLAWEAVVTNDGRVVKMIGDEVMFVTTDPGAACAAALEICERVAEDPSLLAARAGLASGEVSAWGADVFGPVVNLASRLTREVAAGQVAVTPSVRDGIAAADDRWSLHPLGRRQLKGFEEPVELLEVGRRHVPDEHLS